MIWYEVVETGLGEVLLVASEVGLRGLHFVGEKYYPGVAVEWVRGENATLGAAKGQLREYLAGERRVFDLPLDAVGSEFQKTVWRALLAIPYGETRSYGEIAARIGDRKATRAVGAANGRNPISIVVPCHRVVGADGALTGYAGGIGRKQALLRLEHTQGSLNFD